MNKKILKKPNVLVCSGFGLNCELETAAAFQDVGATATIMHINDIISNPKKIRQFDIVAFPGGFSYGDDTGSGKAFGTRVRHTLGDELDRFLERDTLMIGICNGFQILTHAGFLPGALLHNDAGRYSCRWVDVTVSGASPWLAGITTLSLPIAHGEGKYVAPEQALTKMLTTRTEAVLRYTQGPMSTDYDLPYNPNGSLRDIAGITARGGKTFGLMPHPERGFFFTHRPDWTLERERLLAAGKPLPTHADGRKIFENAVKYFD